MNSMKNEISNLSKDKYTIKAKSCQTITFMGARPNYFKITNGGNTPLYLGVSMAPTEDYFDEKILPASTKLCVDAYGSEEVYILNPSNYDANIIITSFTAPFDASAVAMSGFGQDFSNIEMNGEVDATGDLKKLLEDIKTASTNPIPSGGNKIGKVEVEGLDIDNTKLENILTDIKNYLSGNDADSLNMTLQYLKTMTDNEDRSTYFLLSKLFGDNYAETEYNLSETLNKILSAVEGVASNDGLKRKIIAIPLGGSIYDYTLDLAENYKGYHLEKFITVCGSTQGDTVNQVYYFIDAEDVKTSTPTGIALPIKTFNEIAENNGLTKIHIQCDDLTKNDYAIFQIAGTSVTLDSYGEYITVQSGDLIPMSRLIGAELTDGTIITEFDNKYNCILIGLSTINDPDDFQISSIDKIPCNAPYFEDGYNYFSGNNTFVYDSSRENTYSVTKLYFEVENM